MTNGGEYVYILQYRNGVEQWVRSVWSMRTRAEEERCKLDRSDEYEVLECQLNDPDWWFTNVQL